MKKEIKKIYQTLAFPKENKLVKALVKTPLADGVNRLYHYHVRKTGGTSINLGIIQQLAQQPPQPVYKGISKNKLCLREVVNNRVIVGWDKALIQSGNFHFSFSHLSFDEIELPEDTYTFTCFRDPIKRVLSHYNMLSYYRKENLRPDLQSEINYLGNSLSDYLNNMPQKHLMNQLFMFSSNFEIETAINNLNTVDCVVFLEKNGHDLSKLNANLGMEIKTFHEKNFGHKEVVSKKEMEHLKYFMQPDITFFNLVKEKYSQ